MILLRDDDSNENGRFNVNGDGIRDALVQLLQCYPFVHLRAPERTREFAFYVQFMPNEMRYIHLLLIYESITFRVSSGQYSAQAHVKLDYVHTFGTIPGTIGSRSNLRSFQIVEYDWL